MEIEIQLLLPPICKDNKRLFKIKCFDVMFLLLIFYSPKQFFPYLGLCVFVCLSMYLSVSVCCLFGSDIHLSNLKTREEVWGENVWRQRWREEREWTRKATDWLLASDVNGLLVLPVSFLFTAVVRCPAGKHADLTRSQDDSPPTGSQLIRSPFSLCPEEWEASLQSCRSD